MTTKDDTEQKNKGEMTQQQQHCSNECRYLNDFKEFLRDLAKDVDAVNNEVAGEGKGIAGLTCNGNGGGGPEMRILARNHTETYNVSEAELPAEVLICIWQQLLLRQCPEHFRLGITKLAENEIGRELKNAKVQEELQCKQKQQNDTAVNGASEQRSYDLSKLQKFISQYLENKIFLRLSDNSKEDNLKNYADCIRETKGKEVNFPFYAVAQIKNKHRKMEDRHVCLPRFSDIYQLENSYSFFGVFDGHSGSLAATYATNQIPFLISSQLKTLPKPTMETETDYYREVLEASFIKADAYFSQKSLGSGTTAVCALLKHSSDGSNHLYVAWVGDSRCLLVSPTASLQLVKSHKPDSLDERKRIESAETGGSVIFVHSQWRVNGIINVSRSIGDYSVKAVIAEPDFVDVPLQPTHDFLILGTDGLWDHVPEMEIVKCTYKALADADQPVEDIPKHLVELAKQGDSQDNITVVLVLLKDRSNITENYEKSVVGNAIA